MRFQLLKGIAIIGFTGIALPLMAQTANKSAVISQNASGEANDGFSFNLRNEKISLQQLEASLKNRLGLSDQNTLKESKRVTDNFGITHVTFMQYFRGIPVQDAEIIAHIKDGYVTSVNGVALNIPDNFAMPAQPLSASQAVTYAQKLMAVNKLMHTYPATLVLMKDASNKQSGVSLAWNIRIDGRNKNGLLQMSRVFIDAQSGQLINSFPLINNSDVPATALTLYRGSKEITTDSLNDTTYRLRDNQRKIYTFNAGGIMPDTSSNATSPFIQDVDYLNSTTNWGKVKTLNSLSFDTLANQGMLSGGILLAGVGHGAFGSVFGSNFLATSVLYPPYSLPLTTQGLGVQVEDDSLYGALVKVNYQFQAVDSFNFSLPDSSIGLHSWSDTLGNSGKYNIEMEKNPALDAHWGMEQTHDYYLTVFNRDSYDGQGSEIRNYINGMVAYGGTQDNAASLPSPYNSMVYGLGDGVSMGPVVGLDVMGHEFTHLVTDNNGHGGLNYQDQSGALNESFSDMMGTAIEFFADSANANWTIGEGIMLNAPYYMRSMSNPKGPANVSQDFQPQPDTYLGQYWYTGNQDNGGVHINSGVPNKWFYLLSMGGSGTNDNNYHYQVTGQGIKKAEKIAYETFTQYLTPTATFVDAYNGSLNAASDLYGANSSEYNAVKAAWLAVGVPNNDSTNGITTTQVKNNLVKVYPNPAHTEFTVSSSWNQPFEMQIYSISGAKISTTIIKPGTNTVSVSDLSKGVYFLKYEMNQKAYAEPLTVF